MDYMTLKEAAEKWGVTPRRVNYYCAAGRIPGAVKMAGVWLLSKEIAKPAELVNSFFTAGGIVQYFAVSTRWKYSPSVVAFPTNKSS